LAGQAKAQGGQEEEKAGVVEEQEDRALKRLRNSIRKRLERTRLPVVP
jgi:hypothetical protein